MLALPRSVVPWRTSLFKVVNELSFKKTFLLTPPDFSGLIRALSRCVCVQSAAKTRRCRSYTSTRTELVMLALPRSVAPWRTSLFYLVNELSFKKTFLWRHPILRIDNGIKVWFCLFGSQNKSLTELRLELNKIGDAGASGLGAGIAYVSFCLYGWTFFPTSRHPILLGLIRALSRCVCVWFAA